MAGSPCRQNPRGASLSWTEDAIGTDAAEVIADWDRRIEAALWDDERSGSIEAAYDVFEEGASVLDSLDTGSDKTEERDRLRVLSYALLRQANVLRQLGPVEEAALKDQEGLSVARRSGDPVSIGRTLLSMAGTAFASSWHASAFLRRRRFHRGGRLPGWARWGGSCGESRGALMPLGRGVVVMVGLRVIRGDRRVAGAIAAGH